MKPDCQVKLHLFFLCFVSPSLPSERKILHFALEKKKTPGLFFIPDVIIMIRWTPRSTGTKDLTAFSVVCELQFHYLKKYYYVLFANRNNWLLPRSSSSATLATPAQEK